MARTSLGTWQFVLDIGSSSHGELVIEQCQEANGDDLELSFRASIK